MELPEPVLEICEMLMDSRIVTATAAKGGDVSPAAIVETEKGPLFIKWAFGSETGRFYTERYGLDLLHKTGTLCIPEVIGTRYEPLYDGKTDFDYLALEYIPPTEPSNVRAFSRRFAEGLATLHRVTVKDSLYGLEYDNFLGSQPQPNKPRTADWPVFYRDLRLLPQIERARRASLLTQRREELLYRVLENLPELLEGMPAYASLIHGDLWSGNFLCAEGDEPVLIDPAVYYAPREMELAYIELFGGFPTRFCRRLPCCFSPRRGIFASPTAPPTVSAAHSPKPLRRAVRSRRGKSVQGCFKGIGYCLMALLNDEALTGSEIVANSTMNRGRGIEGPNSYARDLGFSPLTFLRERLAAGNSVAWLDLCCGEGRALLETIPCFQEPVSAGQLTIIGVDLMPLFCAAPKGTTNLTLIAASLSEWKPPSGQRYDLITCVHGLHYVGDKLGLLARAASWLKSDGILTAHLDLHNLRIEGVKEATAQDRKLLRSAGFTYDVRRGLIAKQGNEPTVDFPLRYLGADDTAGANRTGQAAVNSHYQLL